jgi:DNA-binding HxlR family transcriptional regulator
MNVLQKPSKRVWIRKVLLALKSTKLNSVEVGTKSGLAQSTAHNHLILLEKEGFVKREKREKWKNQSLWYLTNKAEDLLNYFLELERFNKKWRRIR